ncbi:hypothetical protein AB0G06_43645 [Nonomuraea dietziae]|uniref:hypothetical protein n=1 Tax=Nonomuraea dietziae TaxID=65515 RepID=UPI0033C4BB9B
MNPVEHGWPFTSGPGQVVAQSHWQTMAKMWQSNGVVGVPELAETPSAGNAGLTAVRTSETVITFQPGSATINGYYYDLRAPKEFSLDITGGDFTDDGTGKMIRRDLVVLKVDEALGEFRLVQIKNGVNNSSGSWKVYLNDPRIEIPLVQVDIEQSAGVSVVRDRRWFISQSIKPLKYEGAGFEPVPMDGELAVDTTGSRLVIGKAGQWVSAREVFTNDVPEGVYQRLDGLDTRVNGIDGTITSLDTRLSGEVSALKAKQSTQAITFTPTTDANWDLSGTKMWTVGSLLYVHFSARRLNTNFAATTNTGQLVRLVNSINLPSGTDVVHYTRHPVHTSGLTGTTHRDTWVGVYPVLGLYLDVCVSGVTANNIIQGSFAIPLVTV